MTFPPIPAYPFALDTDRTLFLVYNTSEALTTANNSAWSQTILIEPVAADAEEIWADNGFANISGEMFYYDAVEKNGDGKVFKLKQCARNLAGSQTQYNSVGTWVRGFVVAEHHNQLVDVVLNMENFIGVNFSEDRTTLDWRIRNLIAEPTCDDDYQCPDISFEFQPVTVSPDACTGTTIRYEVIVDGFFTDYRIDFGDGSSTTTDLSGIHIYPPNATIDPVVTVSNDNCQIVQTAIERNNPQEPTPQIDFEPFDIPIPEPPDFPTFTIPDCVIPETTFTFPPFVPPCDIFPGFGLSFSVPSIILIQPPIPSTIDLGSVSIPSTITFVGPTPPIPGTISFTNIPSVISVIDNIPSTISVIDSIPSVISVIGNLPSAINVVGNLPSTISVIDNIPVMISVIDNIPGIISIIDNIPGVISVIGNFASVISVIGNLPSVISLVGNLPSTISVVGNLPSTISVVGNLPSTISVVGNLPSTISVVGNLPSTISVVGNLPSTISVVGNLPSTISVVGNLPSTISLIGNLPSTISLIGNLPSTISLIGNLPSTISLIGNLPSTISLIGNLPSTITVLGTVPSTLTILGTVPSTLTIVGTVPSILSVDWGPIPSVNINWGDVPTCSVEIICPGGGGGFRAAAMKSSNDDYYVDDFMTSEVSESLGIPSVINLAMPDSTEFKLTHNLPEFIELRLPQNFLEVSVTGMPHELKITGLPEFLEIRGNIPREIIIRPPEGLEIPLVFRGDPIPVQLQPLPVQFHGKTPVQENGETYPCFALVPCGT